MPEITLPEVKLPEIKLPDGFREMTKDDIVQAAKDMKLPEQITDRMPGRTRPNPLVPLLALTVIGAVIVAAWWLITSTATGPRVRRAVDDLRGMMSDEDHDLIRFDDEKRLDSLVAQADMGMSQPYASEPFATGDVGEMGIDRDAGVPVGPGTTSEQHAS